MEYIIVSEKNTQRIYNLVLVKLTITHVIKVYCYLWEIATGKPMCDNMDLKFDAYELITYI